MSFWTELPRPVIGLSPMDGVTDAAFRFVVSSHARPDVTFTEFTNVQDVCAGPDHLLSTLRYSEQERPVLAQLYGKDPMLFYRAAHIVCELGFDGLDINMGCPSRNVASSGAGAGLIRTPELAREIMRAARQGVENWAAGGSLRAAGVKASREVLVRAMNLERNGTETSPRRRLPLSVKTRLGYDAVVIEHWIEHLLQERPAAISVHGRTLAQMYRGQADWHAIARAARLVDGTGTLLLGNGDIRSMGDVIRRVHETGVQGVLVGRGTLGSPWFFRDKEAGRALARDADAPVAPPVPTMPLPARFRAMLDHAEHFERMFGRARFPRMRKHLGWYCKGFPHAAAMRNRMVRTSSSDEVRQVVAECLAQAVSTLEAAQGDLPDLLMPA